MVFTAVINACFKISLAHDSWLLLSLFFWRLYLFVKTTHSCDRVDYYCKLANVSQVLRLRQAKNELERKVQDQEEELDEQAGTIQQLEQVRNILHFMTTMLLSFIFVMYTVK